MNVIYPARWHAPGPAEDEIQALATVLRTVEEDLRAAGFTLAADLTAAAEFAIWEQKARTAGD